MDEKEMSILLNKLQNPESHKIYNYIFLIVILIFIFLSGTGIYFLWSMKEDYKENLKFYKERIEKLDQKIDDNNKELKNLEIQKNKLLNDVEKYKNDYNTISQTYKNLINNLNKPLPQPEQDKVFFNLGYPQSQYQKDGGRKFNSSETVKLQIELTERLQFKEQINNLLLTTSTLKEINQTNLNQIEIYKKNIDLCDEKTKAYEEKIKVIQSDRRKEKYKKFLWGLGVGIVAGYTTSKIK